MSDDVCVHRSHPQSQQYPCFAPGFVTHPEYKLYGKMEGGEDEKIAGAVSISGGLLNNGSRQPAIINTVKETQYNKNIRKISSSLRNVSNLKLEL